MGGFREQSASTAAGHTLRALLNGTTGVGFTFALTFDSGWRYRWPRPQRDVGSTIKITVAESLRADVKEWRALVETAGP